jgi:hypothetical protein
VGIALGGADLGVAEEAADHFQRGAARDQQRCKRMPQVVDTDVGDLRDLLHLGPEALCIADRLIEDVAGAEERAALSICRSASALKHSLEVRGQKHSTHVVARHTLWR